MSTKRNHKNNGITFIVYPIVFLIVNVVLLTIAFGPTLKSMSGILDVITLEEAPSFSSNTTNEEVPKIEIVEGAEIVVPSYGDLYANISIPTANIDAPVYYGDTEDLLIKGVGTYAGTYIPGQKRTILMAAHNNLYFHTLGKAKVGDIINITTQYGEYTYQITGSKVALATDTTAYDLTKQEENLILYTCYPFDTLGLTDQRYFVYAKYVSGPQILE